MVNSPEVRLQAYAGALGELNTPAQSAVGTVIGASGAVVDSDSGRLPAQPSERTLSPMHDPIGLGLALRLAGHEDVRAELGHDTNAERVDREIRGARERVSAQPTAAPPPQESVTESRPG